MRFSDLKKKKLLNLPIYHRLNLQSKFLRVMLLIDSSSHKSVLGYHYFNDGCESRAAERIVVDAILVSLHSVFFFIVRTWF